MLERLFTSRTRTKLLSFLLFHQGERHHLRDIARRIKTNPVSTKKELENLEKLGIIEKTTQGNLHLFTLNGRCAIVDDLKRLFVKTELFGDTVRGEFFDATYCLIYGSFAQGTEQQTSDIDLLIISQMREDNLIVIVQRLERQTGREINYLLWNEQTFAQRAKEGHHLLRSIKERPVIMLKGDEDEFRRRIGAVGSDPGRPSARRKLPSARRT